MRGKNKLGRYTLYSIILLFLLPVSVAAQNSWEEKNRAGEKAFQEGRLADANRLFLEALQDAQQYGQKDVRLAPIYNNLALVAFVRNSFIASEDLYEKAIAVAEGARGPDDPLLLPILENLTRLYVKEWSFSQAIRTSQRICAIREKKPGPDSPETAASLNQLATLYLDSVRLSPHAETQPANPGPTQANLDENELDDAARLAKADELYHRVLTVQEKNFGADNARLVDVLQNLGEVQHAQGNGSQAEQSYARAIHIIEQSFGRNDLKLAGPLQHMADLKAEEENYPEAETLYKRALDIREKKLGENDPALVPLLTGYAAVLERTQKSGEAKKLSDRAAALSSSRKPEALKLASQTAPVPYVVRFERAIYDRYAGVHQTCMLVRADGRVRIEEQQREGRAGSSMSIQRSPDGMGDTPAPQETLDTSDTTAHAVKVFDGVVDNESLQQLQAILSAKEVRNIQGSFSASAAADYYGTEKIAVSVLRDQGVQNFAFPDLHVRQPYEDGLKPLFKWLANAEKRKGGVIKDAVANSCSPDPPPAVPTRFGASRTVLTAKSWSSGTTETANPKAAEADGTALPEAASTIKVAVNLVLVRVVVRDPHGNAVGNLRQEDFQLLDNRKPRPITRFSREQGGGKAPEPNPSTGTEKPPSEARSTERSVAYLFDDVHLAAGDLNRIQGAADHQMSLLQPSVQAAIFTTSGQNTLDFTTDRSKLHDALLKIKARKIAGAEGANCPDIDTYMAELIWDKHDEDALGAATEDALHCAFGDNPRMAAAAETMARSTAQQQFLAAETDSQTVLLALQGALRKLAAASGQRTLVLISPGFIAPGREQQFAQLIEGALHTDIVISALDTRGLYNIDSVGNKSRAVAEYQREAASKDSELLTTLADSTGGTFFHNNNDLDTGLGRVAQTPEYSYVLGFSPAEQELDGRFHPLSVTLNNRDEKLAVQARKGYYATPRPAR